VGVANDEGNTREGRKFFGGALSITAGYEDPCGGIGSKNFTDSVAGLSVSGCRDGASVENNDVCGGTIKRKDTALFAELPLDGRAVGLGGAAAELFNKEGAHGKKAPRSI
jgi:hypothetical protein